MTAPTWTALGDPPTQPGDGPWKPGGPHTIDVTPETCGLADDPVAHALYHLAPYGDLTFAGATQALGAWPDCGKLTAPQVAEVLAYYAQPTRRAA